MNNHATSSLPYSFPAGLGAGTPQQEAVPKGQEFSRIENLWPRDDSCPLRFPERIERAKMIQKHELPILEYDSNSEEVIRPNHGAEQLKLPEKCVYAFLEKRLMIMLSRQKPPLLKLLKP